MSRPASRGFRITRQAIVPKHGLYDYVSIAAAKQQRVEEARQKKGSRPDPYAGDSHHFYIGPVVRKVPLAPLKPMSLNSKVELAQYFARPSWSVNSLLAPSTSGSDSKLPAITSETLSHLLKLSALPQPETKEEESKMLKTLRSQLHFVREIQSVDTKGIKPLSAIREDTEEAREEMTIGLDTLKTALGKEKIRGRMRRSRRVVVNNETAEEQEKRIERERQGIVTSDGGTEWKPLEGAPRTYGKYFVVETEGKVEAGS